MSKTRITKQITRKEKVSKAEAERLKKLRGQAKVDHPPAPAPTFPEEGIGAELRRAREAKGLTWYAVARAAEIPHASTVRNIELGTDAKISTVLAIAKALGLVVEVREAA